MSDKQTPENAVDYKATLNFPDTEFAMKANLAVREAKWLEEWYADNIYQQIRASRIGKKNMFFMTALHMPMVKFIWVMQSIKS